MSTVDNGVVNAPSEEPDAVCRGWWAEPAGEHKGALFMLAGTAMGVSVTDSATGDLARPEWVDLATVVHLDALGDPEGGVQAVELGLSTGIVRSAGWTLGFCDAVVDALQRLVVAIAAAPTATPTPVPPAPTGPAASDPLPPELPPTLTPPAAAPLPSPFAPAGLPAPGIAPGIETPPPFSPSSNPPSSVPPSSVAPSSIGAAPVSPLPVDQSQPEPVATQSPAPIVEPVAGQSTSGHSLVLEDVVYLGGHPSESKKKKRCTATLTDVLVVIDGPGEMSISVPWADVSGVEVQNSDEARFRMNLRVHRDASAVILTTHDGAKVLLEARDCPTIPLRSAVVQLLAGQTVEVA